MTRNLNLILIFFVALSLAGLSERLSSNSAFPLVQLAHANVQPCQAVGSSGSCSEFWYPAGPAMTTLTTPIFSDGTAEYTDLESASSSIDFTDVPCGGTPTTGNCGSLGTSPNFLVTAPVPESAFYEIQFHLDNNFWNCNFNFGNSACGVQIREAFAHMFDKASFCANSVIAGVCTPIDNPVPTTSLGGLPSPNPCGYDLQFPQSGTSCVVGAPGGTAYHINAAGGANGFPWLYAPGSADLNAAAQHLLNAGVATGFNTMTSVLTGAVTTNTPDFFIRSDDPARKQLGEGVADQICYLFTGSYTQPCIPYLHTGEAPLTAFPGFTTSKTSLNLNWWIYTAAYNDVPFFDDSLYHYYNSRFVSGIPSIQQPTGPCSPQAVPTNSASDYMYLCNSNYDTLSNQLENSPCLTAPGDPVIGQPNNGPGGTCPSDPTKLSAVSAGIQAEASFGSGAFTLPVFQRRVQFGYINGWSRATNSATVGLPNSFTWLNTWNPTPAQSGTIRQGFSETTRSVNPFIASTPQDRYIVDSIYDSLMKPNPLSPGQLLNWMTLDIDLRDNSTVMAMSNYTPPPGTVITYHFQLLSGVGLHGPFFQDGRPVTAFDVAFSYLSLLGSGAFLGTGASAMTGITVLTPNTFDIGVSSNGVFTLPNLGSIPILPGRYWTSAGSSTWDSATAACEGTTSCPKTQYSLAGSTVICPSTSGQPGCASFPANLMQLDTTKTSAGYDPIANHLLIGSGPWECGVVTSSGSGSCSSSGAENPPQPGGSYILTRFGNGLAPASSTSGIYFRSSGNLALYLWTQESDVNPIIPISSIFLCFNQPFNPNGGCAHWQRGIGRSTTGVVGITQLSLVLFDFNWSWVRPFSWVMNQPVGMASFSPAPILYEGSVPLSPCSIDPINGYDC
jgi:hypothetical protein